jgi:hypothetical protein
VGRRVLFHAKSVTRWSWDYRAKQGFYVGPALDHYRCYKLVRLETKQKVISDTNDFRHTYLQIPVLLADDKITNGLQVMVGALQNAPPPTSSHQLDAIETLRMLLEKWKHPAPPVLQIDSHPVRIARVSPTPMPSRVQDMTPAPNLTNNLFHALANDDDEDAPSATTWLPPPLPTSVPRTPSLCAHVAPLQQATPTRLVFDNIASPSWPNTTLQPSPLMLPRVSVTPSLTQGHVLHHHATVLWRHWYNTISLLSKQRGLHTPWPPNLPAYAKHWSILEPELTEFACLCARLISLNEGHSLAILDKESGQLLEHHQLQRDPCYKEVWDQSYSNEHEQLCQGIGMGDKAGNKRVAGINTFQLT